MNKKINFDLQSIKLIFNRNKTYALPSTIILICILLFFQFVIPQFNSLLDARKEAQEASLNLRTLKENLNVLVNADENVLDSQLQILNLALPAIKDFSGILNSIYYASQKAGVELGSFSLQIGDLSSFESGDNFSTVSMSLPINGGALVANSFVEAIAQAVPLSEVSVIKTTEERSTINLSFYYKSLNPLESEVARVVPVSQKGLELINKLRDFENISTP